MELMIDPESTQSSLEMDSIAIVWHGQMNPPARLNVIAKYPKSSKGRRPQIQVCHLPGNGIQPADIQAIVYAAKVNVGVRSGLETNAFVLMNDGRVMDNMPVAPGILDVATSRSRKPDRCFFWKSGNDGVLFQWNSERQEASA